jgi:hypothetical protein
MADPAFVRARHMKSRLEAIRQLPACDAERVLARIPAELQRRVADAASIDWIDMGIDLDVTRAIYLGLGQAGFERFFRNAQAEAFSGPLLKVFVDAVLRVFRLDAASFAGWVGKGWPLVFRNCGRWRVERVTPGDARLRLEGLPPECATHDVWLRSVSHSLSAFFIVAKEAGECTLEAMDPDAGTATYRVTWR